MAELRACPFCGGEAEVFSGTSAAGGFFANYSCAQCCAEAPQFYAKYKEVAIAQAADAWNARPEEDRLRAALVQARDALLANWHIADMGSRWIADWWQECSRCHGIGPVNDEELSKVVHREDCDRKKLLATLDAALAVKA